MNYAIGIDLGTSKIAAVMLDENGRLEECFSISAAADIKTSDSRAEQETTKILAAVIALLKKFNRDKMSRVSSIGLTGQMHGVMLWNAHEISPLYTWRDKRISEDEFGGELLQKYNLKDGFGCSTLAWLARNGKLATFNCAATVHDYLAWRLCGSQGKALTDPSDAASWGLFDITNNSWNYDAVKELDIPCSLMPEIRPAGSVAGKISPSAAKEFGLPEGIAVYLPAGDNQTSILASAENTQNEIYLTIGTGAQLSIVINKEQIKTINPSGAAEIRPFFEDKILLVAAPLCGGQAFSWLADAVIQWSHAIGAQLDCNYDEVFRRLDALAMTEWNTTLKIAPSFLGERNSQLKRGAVNNISLDNFSLGQVTAALAKGIVANMRNMMPENAFELRSTVVGSGNAVRKLECVKRAIKETFSMPLRIPDAREEAACGAARLASDIFIKKLNQEASC